MAKYTAETLFDGRLRLYQPKTGYRHAVDPILLCNQVHPEPGSRILDAGCGCGIIPLILGFNHPATTITGIEIQTELAALARKSVAENRMDDRISILNRDILETTPSDTGGRVDLIVSNPPFKPLNSGRINPNDQKAVARHEIKLSAPALFAKADELLQPKGIITVIYPADRLFDLNRAAAPTSIRPRWIRFIHTSRDRDAKRIIFSGEKNTKASCRVLPPLYLDAGKPDKI